MKHRGGFTVGWQVERMSMETFKSDELDILGMRQSVTDQPRNIFDQTCHSRTAAIFEC